MGNECCSLQAIGMDAFSRQSQDPMDQSNRNISFDQTGEEIQVQTRNEAFNRYLCNIAIAPNASDFYSFKENNDNQSGLPADISSEDIQSRIANAQAQNLEAIIENNKINDCTYNDTEFPPTIDSVSVNVAEFRNANKVKWLRATEFLDESQIQVFGGAIEPCDIIQGSLGDCYFLSALSSLAEHTNLISRLFDTVKYNKEGFYAVWLNHDGIWKHIVLDDYFPCFGQIPAFSKSNGSELWVMILEKAYAKLFGNYHNIEAGLPEQAVTDLTGSPYDWIFTKDIEKTWNFIIEKVEDEKKTHRVYYILNAGSKSDEAGGIEVKDETGIISGHAYSVLDAKQFETEAGTERIIQLRNPWGQHEWAGDWSDKSDKWTPEYKKLCGWNEKDDGIFWIPLENFCQKYSSISCNYLERQNFYNSTIVDFNVGNTAFIQMKMNGEGRRKGYIQFHQKDPRNFPNSDYQLSQVRMMVFNGNSEKVGKQWGDVSAYSRNDHIEIDLCGGESELFVLVEVKWGKSNQTREIVISSYTEKQVDIGEVIYLEDEELSTQLDKCFLNVAPKKKGEEHVYKEDCEVFRYTNSCFGHFFFVYVNQSATTTFQEKVQITNLLNLQICLPYTDSLNWEITLPPLSKKVVKYRILPVGNGGYSYSFNQNDLLERILQSKESCKPRKIDKKVQDIFFYSYFHSDGCAFYYLNNTDQIYCETLKLTLINLESEDGLNTDENIRIKVEPQSGKLLKFKEIDNNAKSSYQLAYYAYFE